MAIEMTRDQDGAAKPWAVPATDFIIQGSELNPDHVTAFLGIEPTKANPPGDDPWGPPGRQDGRWVLGCDEWSTRDLSEQLDTVLTPVEARSGLVHSLLAEPGVRAVIRISGYAENDAQIMLSAAEVLRLARLGVPLVLAPSLSER
ncbi:hypothetical protein C6N75_19915 [Streptomyces solincola]|uniref:DUF4279 domain-containing protein n=1 Tax=Streptomyces solincola TaxID=2100817 RepID=A0A2S9PSW0_9ACTN|nr:DUF4279 domain-containing protein [Streptomyces solincola]PRH77508.1 hypothetical protein C6N75_19915 [Streptomyces solincola]